MGSKGGKDKRSKKEVSDVLADLSLSLSFSLSLSLSDDMDDADFKNAALMIDDMDDTDFKNAVALLGGSGDRNLRGVDKALLKLNKDDLIRKRTELPHEKLDEY